MTALARLVGLFLVLCTLSVVALNAHAEAVANHAISATPPSVTSQQVVAATTDRYLAKVPAADKARTNAYFEGGYWLILWGLVYGLVIDWILLATGLSVNLRNRAERITKGKNRQTALYALQIILLTTLLIFPLTVYQEFFREHQYGLSNLSFPAWLGETATDLAVSLVMGAIFISAIYWVIRRAPRSWWVWGTGLSVLFMAIGVMIAPVFIAPLFNKYQPLENGPVRENILSLARANGVPAEEVYGFDASKQTKRVSANVSGLMGTTRISLNDNLLKRTSLPEIRAVMGHEMGHYVLNHVTKLLIFMGIVLLGGFAFMFWALQWALRRWGAKWKLNGPGDVAALPLLAALLSIYMFCMTPVINNIIRSSEVEADIYGLNAAREPEGFAETALKLGEYRKLEPGAFEEWFFFDHPSGRSRIEMAMRWKAEQQSKTDVQ